jgi:hypothetical protein
MPVPDYMSRCVRPKPRALEARLAGGLPTPIYADGAVAEAARILDDLRGLWANATPAERGEIIRNLFSEVRVRDDEITESVLAREEYLPLVASAYARSRMGVAGEEGFEPSIP